jgi:DNA-binding SARP family transcriptional activator
MVQKRRMGAHVRYSVLGPLEVRDGERLLNLGSRKQRAVLALLLIQAGSVVSVDALIDGLWGESAPATAQGTLQAYISNLRKILEPSRAPGEPPAVLVSRPPGYVIDVAPDALDASRFEGLAARGGELLRAGRADEARAVLNEALALWRGAAYGDLAFEPFAQEEIARLEELRLNTLEDKVEAELALGRHRTLIGELRRLVEKEPLRERLRGNLALALYRDARQADALATLRGGREYLADELGIDPGPELRDLEDRMLRQDTTLEWRPLPSQSYEVGEQQGLVGRRAELDVLSRAAHSARSGRGRVLLIAGDPGIGKTTLLEEFSTWEHGLSIHWGYCHEGEGAPPFWPWRQILESLVSETSPGAVLGAAGARSADLLQVLPELATDAADEARDVVPNPEEARFRLYVAVASVLTQLARNRPLMIVLDDLHWSDSATLRLLEFVAKKIRQGHILIVATYRDIEVGPDHQLSPALASLARLPMVERVTLDGFSPQEVSSYVLSVTGSAPAEAFVDELHSRTGGNPFFLAEVLRLVEGAVKPEEVAIESIARVPANVRDVILARVGTLPPEAQRFLEEAAVLGRAFDVQALAALESVDEGEVLDALTPAVKARLIVATDPIAGDYRFSHALVRDALYEELTPGIKARLHLSWGEVLEALRASDPAHAAQIAAHYYQAGVLGAADKAVRYGTIAADHAVAQLAYEDAERLYRSALRFVDRMSRGRERDAAELRLRQGLNNVLVMIRGYTAPEIAPGLERIRELTDEVGDERQRASALWGSVSFHAVLPEMNVALGLSDDLLQLAVESDDPSVKWVAHTARGRCCWQIGSLAEARRHFDLALGLVDSVDAGFIAPMLPEQDAETYCKTVLAEVMWLQGDTDAAWKIVDEQLQRAKARGHPLPYVVALGTCSILAAYEGNVGEVKTRIEELIEIGERKGFPWYRLAGSALRGWAVAHEGDPAAGLDEMVAAMAAIEASGSRMITGMVQPLLAATQLDSGHPEEALRLVDRGLAIADETGHGYHIAELYRLRGEALQIVRPGDHGDIEAALNKALQVAREQGAGTFEARAQASLIKWEESLGSARTSSSKERNRGKQRS